MKIRLTGVKINKLQAARTLRDHHPDRPTLMEAAEMIEILPLEIAIYDGFLDIFSKTFYVDVVELSPPSYDGFQVTKRIKLIHPDGSVDVDGNVQNIADAIYKLLEKYPEDKIVIMVPNNSPIG